MSDKCNVPPIGWRCTRANGHEGPCAALPENGISPAQWVDVYYFARAVELPEFIARAQEVFEKGK